MSTASKRASARKTYRTEWVDRWSPPKPLVGLQAIEKVLNRHTFLVCPESRLVVAVLAGLGRAMSEVGAVMIVGGNIDGATRVMTTAIALETSKGDLALAIALGVVLIVIILALNALAYVLRQWAMRRFG